MTENDQENIERKLNHVLDMGQRIIDLYPHITCTERAALLLAMTASVRQVAANMNTLAALLRINLLDPFRIDYTDYARRIENLQKIWDEELKGAPIFHNLDTQSLPITNPHDIALKEDTHYDLTFHTSENDGYDFLMARVWLMENAPLMCETINSGLLQLSKTLREITEDYLLLKGDVQKQDERLRELERKYEEAMWENDRKRLSGEAKEFVILCNNAKDKGTFQLFLEHKIREATDPHDNEMLAELNECFLAGGHPATFIVENRDKLKFEHLASHFCFVRYHRIISRQIETFDLLLPADSEYRDLFVNQAAQELAFRLKHTIANAVDFRHNYQYAALQMAMQDLGLIYRDRNNGVQMMEYINRDYLKKGEQIKDQKTLTQWIGKLLGHTFGMMDDKHLKGNYDLKDYEKMKDQYWLCLSIINKVVQKDLKKSGFASYLYEEHEMTPNISDYRNAEGQSIMQRLSELKSVIRGESPFD